MSHIADIHAAITLTDAAQTVTTGFTQPASPRALSVTGNAAGIAGDVVFTGTDPFGAAVTETFKLNGAYTVFGHEVFASVTQAVVPKKTHTSGDTVSIGWADALFTEYEARSFVVRSSTPLADPTVYPAQALSDRESMIRYVFELAAGVAFVPTKTTEVLDGNDSETLRLSHAMPVLLDPPLPVTVVSASIDGVALTSSELAALKCYPSGVVVRTDGQLWSSSTRYQDRAATITYWHGWPVTPEPVRIAALRMLVHELIGSDVPDGAVSFSDGGASYSFARPGQAPHWTGVDAVDAVLLAYREGGVVVV